MIYVYLEGRLGNLLYSIAAIATLANTMGEEYRAVVNKNYYCTPPDDCLLPEYIAPLRTTILRNVPFADKVPDNCKWWTWDDFISNRILSIKKDENICLYSMYVKMSDCSLEIVSSLFSPSSEIKTYLLNKYPSLNEQYTCSVAVRRGDFLNLPIISPAEDYAFYRKCMKKLEQQWQTKDIHYFITSDDTIWCKKHFVGEQYTIVDDSYINQLYIASFCKCNILSNSTFAVWGG